MLRIATYNTALTRDDGSLPQALAAGCEQAVRIATTLRRLAADVLVIQELDHRPAGHALDTFCDGYLAVGHPDTPPLRYPHRLHLPSNTGIPTGLDLSGDGRTDGPDDAQGYGHHPGQYASAVLSRFPLGAIRTWQHFLWRDLPAARWPTTATGGPHYPPEARDRLRLSSKTHALIEILDPQGPFALLIAHPTPPVFDGPERRNALRNHDELRLLVAILSDAPWLVDDQGGRGGLPGDLPVIVLGDLNAPPGGGAAGPAAMDALLQHPRLDPSATRGRNVPRSSRGDSTCDWGMRVDYVLPSRDWRISGSGVCWPADPAELQASDHRPVWVDLLRP